MYRLAIIPCALRATTVSAVPVVRPAVVRPLLAPSMTQTLLRASFSTSQQTPPRHRPTSEKPSPGVPHSQDVERAIAYSAEDSTEGMSAKDTEDSTPLGSPQLKRHLEELLAQDAKKKQQK